MAEADAPASKQDKMMKSKGGPSMKMWLVDKPLGSAANLSKLLPIGTTLAPAFTKGGKCKDHDVNFWFTWGLIGFLTLLWGLLSITDSVTDKDGVTYYGYATWTGFELFNRKLSEPSLFHDEGEKKKQMESKKLKKRDLLHAIVSASVFLVLAFCDGGVQKCLVPSESEPWQEFLANVPLAVGFLAGFLFMVFPSTRNGIGGDGPPPPPAVPEAGTKTPAAPHANPCDSSLTTMDTTQVAPPTTCYEIDDQVV
jgi:hypothetical protein